jgi:hypothetical protein
MQPLGHAGVTPSPFLTDDEVDDICDGLEQNAAKVRFLQQVVRVPVKRKPNGRPLVLRADLQQPSSVGEPGRATVRASNEPAWSRRAP